VLDLMFIYAFQNSSVVGSSLAWMVPTQYKILSTQLSIFGAFCKLITVEESDLSSLPTQPEIVG